MAKERKPNVMDSENLCEPCCPMDMKPCMNPSNLLEVWHGTHSLGGGHAPFRFSPHEKKAAACFQGIMCGQFWCKWNFEETFQIWGGPTNVVSELKADHEFYFWWGGGKAIRTPTTEDDVLTPNVKKMDKIYTSGTPLLLMKRSSTSQKSTGLHALKCDNIRRC
jgi:hypothetical protein